MDFKFKNLVDMQEQSCAKWGARPAFGTKRNDSWKWVSFQDYAQLVDDFRSGLNDLGIEPGDRVAIISRNCVEWAIACYAAFGLGATIVPMYESQSSADWEYMIKNSGASIVFANNSVIFDVVEKLHVKLDKLKHVINLHGSIHDANSFMAILAKGREKKVESRQVDLESCAAIIYTSGTTDKPKGVMLSHKNILTQPLGLEKDYTFTPDDRTLSFLPWAHIFGQVGELHSLILLGYSTAFAEGVEHILSNLSEVRPTMLISVPRIFNRIYDAIQSKIHRSNFIIKKIYNNGMAAAGKLVDGRPLTGKERFYYKVANFLIFRKVKEKFGGNLKYAISGGAALDPEVGRFMERLGITVYEGYGLTETSPMISTNCPAHAKIGTVGKPVPGVTIRLDRKSITEHSNPEDGEIIAYGDNIMMGYYDNEEATRKVMTEDGGFRTGDVGRFDEDGYLKLTGRIKEQYKLQNGKWVVPGPIEDKLTLSPFVGAAMVYGEQREYNIAILSVNIDEVVNYAVKRGIYYKNTEQLSAEEIRMTLAHPTIQDLFQNIIALQGQDCKEYEKPRKFVLSSEEWNPITGLTTQTFKLKRLAIAARYADQIDQLFLEDDIFAYSNQAVYKDRA